MAQQVRRVRKVQQDPQVLTALMVLLDHKVRQVPQVLTASMAQQVRQGQQVPME
jgi:hypothetical protein